MLSLTGTAGSVDDKFVASLSDGGVVFDLVDVVDDLRAQASAVVLDAVPQVDAVDVDQVGVVTGCAQQRRVPATSL